MTAAYETLPAAGPPRIPAALAARSPFAAVDVCRTAGLELRPGTVRPSFDDDCWDLTGLAGAPKRMRTYTKVWDFTAIADPAWRLTAKEYMLALLAPHHRAVAALPLAFHTAKHPSTCRNDLIELIRWFQFLTAEGLASLAEVTQADCDAFRIARSRGVDGPRLPESFVELSPGAMLTSIKPVKYLAFYTELFTADGYAPDFVPWPGKNASQVAAWRPSRDGNKTGPMPEEVLQPALAASLYLAQTLGPHLVPEAARMLTVTQGRERLPNRKVLTPEAREAIGEELQRRIAEGDPLPRIVEPRIKARLTRGWSAGDPLLEVNIARILQTAAGVGDVPPSVIATLRPAFQEAVAAVGIAEEFGRDAAVVEAFGGGAQLPWTAPVSAHDLRILVSAVTTACHFIIAATVGMRPSELAELTDDSPLPPVPLPGGATRYRLASRLIKGQPYGGVREQWVVLEPAWQAVQLAIKLRQDPDSRHVFTLSHGVMMYPALRAWVNGPAGQRLGLPAIPDGPINPRMMRRSLAIALACRPGGLLAAKIHLKHASVATTEGYAHRPGGAQSTLLAEVRAVERKHHLELTAAAFRDFQAGRLPAGPGARDLIAVFEHIDAAPAEHVPGTPGVLESDRRLENLLRQQAKHLHVQAANYCWFRDPAKALCLKLAGTPSANRPLTGMCDSARCPQATHHPCHRPVWQATADTTQSMIDNPRFPKGERTRLVPERDRALRVVAEIDAAQEA